MAAIHRTDDTVYTYRNIHTDELVRLVGAPMLDDALYAYTSGALDEGGLTTYRMTWGMEGRDGTTFDPRHWRRVW